MSMVFSFGQPLLDPARKTGLVLCGMGGPDGPEAVEPFLRNLFRDPAILPMPKWLGFGLSRMLARRRAPAVRLRYAAISPDSASPQLQTTTEQALELARRMNLAGDHSSLPTDVPPRGQVVGGVAMRYWHPFPKEAIAQLLDQGVEQFLVVPTYPQFAGATTGSTLEFVRKGVESLAPAATVHEVVDWHMLPGYLQALAEPVSAAVTGWMGMGADPKECAVVYVAHSLPEKFIERGDPYLDQVNASVEGASRRVETAVFEQDRQGFLADMSFRNSDSKTRVAFQSKVGPIKWLGPEVTREVGRLANAGCRRLFVQPISFTCEHVETLHELDIELRDIAAGLGIEDFARGPALNLHPGWLDSLASELTATAFEPEVGAHV
ncbi:MAG: ferrochelatase [Gemmatimonadales bacterium]|nr:ferrochelatase [Gemmatimonadales bacterium]